MWSYVSAPLHVTWCLVKHKDNKGNYDYYDSYHIFLGTTSRLARLYKLICYFLNDTRCVTNPLSVFSLFVCLVVPNL